MILRSHAIALRLAPFSRTSHVVTWLTPDHGIVATVVKGAQRPKSAFLGQYDLFYLCEILYYSRERNGVHILKECSALDTRNGIRGNWRATSCASYFCGIAARACQPGEVNGPMFVLLDRTLAHLNHGSDAGLPLLIWYELRAMECLGFGPRLRSCEACGVARDSGQMQFELAAGRLLCASCAATRHGSAMVTITGEEAGYLEDLLGEDEPASVSRGSTTDRGLLKLGELVGRFVDHHASGVTAGREIVTELLQ